MADSYSASFSTFCCQELMASPFLRGAACEGRKSCPHRLAIGEVVARTDEMGVEVADGVVAVFQMTQEA